MEQMEQTTTDQTVEAICEWIQGELKREGYAESLMLPKMISALAELLTAKAATKIQDQLEVKLDINRIRKILQRLEDMERRKAWKFEN
jgi:hypothetical protein